MKAREKPELLIGKKLSDIDSTTNWCECYPVVRDGLIIGVVDQYGELLAGSKENSEYDAALDYYVI